MDALNRSCFCYNSSASADMSDDQNHFDNDADNNETGGKNNANYILGNAHAVATTNYGVNERDPSVTIDVDDNDDVNGVDDAATDHRNLSNDLASLLAVTADAPQTRELQDTRELQAKLRTALDEYGQMIRQARESNRDYFPCEFASNFLSGATAFLMCFGAGTLTSSALGEPAVGWAISTAMWALSERFIPMVRNTTWENKHADKTYPLLGNLIQRAARDAVRNLAGIKPRHADGNNQGPSLDEINFPKAWWGKMLTDDLPYYFYTLCYGLRYTIIADKDLPATSPASLISLLVAGTLAGAFTAVTMQYTRRQRYQRDPNADQVKGQAITKTLGMWKKELEILEATSQLMHARSASRNSENTADTKLNKYETEEKLNKAIEKARRKATALTSLQFEFTAMFNLKLDTGDRRGEVAGKLSEFIAGLLAKGTVLGLSTAWNYAFTMKMMATATSVAGRTGIMLGQYSMLIVAFNLRKEAELGYRGLIGVGLGIADIVSKKIRGFVPGETDNRNAGLHLERENASIRSVGSTQDLVAEYRRQNRKEKKVANRLRSIDGTEDD
ncbi:hypothetical protein KTQ42_13445|uniref:hypothetical protein n=1 Tax=Noviherbaspirillum sp. L7-7A TaxID=2850560 RepID=UPI001C2C512A|nr:hypothetical protein [Noviherbaspirillum sp. L7-7A]MBV0880310.1 hypothetical protein [Noviherbaspirillum sp. L7-7A]